MLLLLCSAVCILSILLTPRYPQCSALSLLFAGILTFFAWRNHRLSQTDPLTGAYNRRRLEAMGPIYAKSPHLTLVFLDVDNLKQVNDTQGHAAGDALLRETADILRNSGAHIYRIGGDEFLLISTRPDFRWTPPTLPVSHGTAVGKGTQFDALLRQAEQAMYRSKK